MRVRVLVSPKKGILDPQGSAVQGSLEQLGFAVSDARVGRIVDLDLDAGNEGEARQAAEQMCEQLLANTLIESYEIEVQPA
jgi:phosphoribosylformylglycinamidine synthase